MAAPLPEADRRRLLELRGLHPTLPVLVFHPLLTLVTGFGRDASDSVVESLGRLGAPLGPAVSGTVEIGGQIRELPGALADPGARPEVVRGPMLVGEIGRRRAADAAVDVNKRAARVSRREAALARRDQLVDRLEQLSTRADELERDLNEGRATDDGEIQRLLVASRQPQPATPNPIITALIDEWDALVVERKANSGGPSVDRAEANLEAIHTRIAQRDASDEPAANEGALNATGVARAQEAHAAVERLAAGLDEARRGERKAAGQKLANAVEAERQALAELGFESYASFLLAMAEGRGQDDRSHDEAALVTAESALSRARDREQVFVLLSERELDLRARVARLLGRLPGPDVGAELRGGHGSSSPSSGARDRLEVALRSADVPVGDDPIGAAERYLDSSESRRARGSALRAELEEIESEGSRLDEQLDLAEHELAAAERDLIASVSGTLAGREAPVALSSAEPEELTAALAAIVVPSGAPLVIGECFVELSAEGRSALLDRLAELSRRRQVVVVSEVGAVAEWAMGLGIDGVVWTPLEADAAQWITDEPEATEAFDAFDTVEAVDEVDVVPEVEPIAAEPSHPLVAETGPVEPIAAEPSHPPVAETRPVEPIAAEPSHPPVAETRPAAETRPVEPMVGAATADAITSEPAPHPERRPAWPPDPSALRFGWEAPSDGSPAAEPAEPAPVPDFFAPASDRAEPPAPAAAEPAATETVETVEPVERVEPAAEAAPVAPPLPYEPLRSVKALPSDEPPPPSRPRRVPALFDREAQDAADAEAATAIPVEVDAPAPVVGEPGRRNPLDDLFGGMPAAEPKPSSRRKSKAKAGPEPKPKPEPKAKAKADEPEPSRATGPWKPPPSGRKRKQKNAPVPPPWEGRFDTSRAREMPGKPVAPPPPGSAPLAVCVRHTGAVTRKRCARCNEPACDECLVTPRGRRSSMCIECAIIEAGVRSRRRLRG